MLLKHKDSTGNTCNGQSLHEVAVPVSLCFSIFGAYWFPEKSPCKLIDSCQKWASLQTSPSGRQLTIFLYKYRRSSNFSRVTPPLRSRESLFPMRKNSDLCNAPAVQLSTSCLARQRYATASPDGLGRRESGLYKGERGLAQAVWVKLGSASRRCGQGLLLSDWVPKSGALGWKLTRF